MYFLYILPKLFVCVQAYSTNDSQVVEDFKVYFTNQDGYYVVNFSHNVLGQHSFVKATPNSIPNILSDVEQETNGSVLSATVKCFDP